ncbi:MAG: PTS sugar transporter subunit IIA [bacterium]
MELALRDAAKLLGVSEKTVRGWIRHDGMPAHRVSDEVRFSRAELLEWATAHGHAVAGDLFAEPHAADTPSLADALAAGGVHHGLSGADRESALRALVERMRLPPDVDRAFLLHVLLAREAMQSTAIGDGVAIPHVRNPIVLHVEQPMVTLGFLETPVDFGALDGRPVHTLFAVVSPTVRAHLHLLSRIAFALRDPAFRDVVRRRGSEGEVVAEARRAESELARRASDGAEPSGA